MLSIICSTDQLNTVLLKFTACIRGYVLTVKFGNGNNQTKPILALTEGVGSLQNNGLLAGDCTSHPVSGYKRVAPSASKIQLKEKVWTYKWILPFESEKQ